MDKLHLYNTESRTKEELTPSDGNTVRLYTCGPTVYNFAHIGNFRTYVFEDILRRSIKYFGYGINQVMNITDIDDKTIKGAIAGKMSLVDYTRPYTDAFFEDCETLGIEKVEHYPRATDFIPKMIEMIETLLDKGFAYKGKDGSIYYSITSFEKYGRLSHLKLDELQEGASERVESDEYDKEQASDFVLWKAYVKERDGDIFWESPFGLGRPGWHIECSAMATSILGSNIDLHAGGIDNIFPHHENEIAQSEGCFGCQFVHQWIHAYHLVVDGKKMSKSLKNFYTLRDLLEKGYSGRQVRYMLMQTHYRISLNFTLAGMNASQNALRRIDDFIARLAHINGEESDIAPVLDKAKGSFKKSLGDDLNVSGALAALFDLIREVNTLIDKQVCGSQNASAVIDLLKEFDTVLNVLFAQCDETIPEELLEALEKRNNARAVKDWAEADKWRNFIQGKGYTIEDTPSGSRLKR